MRGAWVRFTPSPGANPNLGNQVDRAHLDPVDYGREGFDEDTPPNYGTAISFASDDFFLPVPMYTPPGVPMDRSPLGHDKGAVTRGENWLDSQNAANLAHSEDYGAGELQTYEAPIMRDVSDSYGTQRIEAEFATSSSRAALTRGRNSLPENNPDGPPPQGHYVMRWIDRKFSRKGIRTDQQPLKQYRAAVANEIVPGEAGSATTGVYASPFPNLASARLLKLTTPMIRRVPRPPDDADQQDGTQDPQYAAPAYWNEF